MTSKHPCNYLKNRILVLGGGVGVRFLGGDCSQLLGCGRLLGSSQLPGCSGCTAVVRCSAVVGCLAVVSCSAVVGCCTLFELRCRLRWRCSGCLGCSRTWCVFLVTSACVGMLVWMLMLMVGVTVINLVPSVGGLVCWAPFQFIIEINFFGLG